MPPNLWYFLQFVAIYILLAWSIYLPMKCGQLYNGVIYCATISAYFAGYVALNFNWPFIIILICAAGVGAFIGFVPAIRLAKGKMFDVAIATIALIYITQNVIKNIPFLGGLRGYRGFPMVDHLLIKTFIILLFLAQRGKIGLWQEEEIEELYITVIGDPVLDGKRTESI